MISNYNDFYRALHDPSVTEIDLAGNAKIELKEPIELDRPVTIRGNGGMIYGNVPHAVRITGSEITIEDLVMNEFGRAVMIDAEDHTAENIILRKLMINDPGYGVGISIGSSESNGQIKNVTISGCTFNSGYSDENADKLGFTDGSNAIYVSAAAPLSSRTEDLVNACLDGLLIENCEVLGPRRYGVNMLVGISIPEPGTDFMSQKAKIIDCSIRNVKVLNNHFDYCREMAVSLSGGCLNNYGSTISDLEIAGNNVVYGICGVGFSAAGPILPTSVSTAMGMRHGSIHDNYLEMMELDVGEPSRAINLTGGRCEGFGGIEVYQCYVEDVDIYNNVIVGADRGIELAAANSMGDEAVELSDNYIRDVRIFNNKMKDTETAFCFMPVYAEGRRYDWNWGWEKKDYVWAEPSKDHSPTVKFCRNYISDINCHDNHVDGCRNEIFAVAASGRGHAVFKDNKMTENIRYVNNTFVRSEGHVNVADTYYSDWVIDAGGNEVSKEFKK